MQESPGRGCGARVLTSHKQSNHNMRYLMVGKLIPIAVRLTHQGAYHVRFVILTGSHFQRFLQSKTINQRTVLVPSFLALTIST